MIGVLTVLRRNRKYCLLVVILIAVVQILELYVPEGRLLLFFVVAYGSAYVFKRIAPSAESVILSTYCLLLSWILKVFAWMCSGVPLFFTGLKAFSNFAGVHIAALTVVVYAVGAILLTVYTYIKLFPGFWHDRQVGILRRLLAMLKSHLLDKSEVSITFFCSDIMELPVALQKRIKEAVASCLVVTCFGVTGVVLMGIGASISVLTYGFNGYCVAFAIIAIGLLALSRLGVMLYDLYLLVWRHGGALTFSQYEERLMNS